MKRDFELIRKIMMEVASTEAGGPSFRQTFPGEYPDALVFEHQELLIEAGLLVGKISRSVNGIQVVMIQRLTWEGHAFVEAAAADTLWKKAFATVKDKGGAMTFDVLKSLLSSLAMKAAGLS